MVDTIVRTVLLYFANMGLATERNIIDEGIEAFKQGDSKNPYLQNTWAYTAWWKGYSMAALRDSQKHPQP